MSKFYPLTVTHVQRETRDAVVLTLVPQDDVAAQFGFIQGQYLTFRQTIEGEEVRRSYSICAAIQDPAIRVGIKHVSDGLFSGWANESVSVGDTLEAMPPMGSFYSELDANQSRHYVAFVGGSGITPVLGIIKTTLLAEPRSSFTLFYGNRASGSIMFREELEDLKNEYLGRFQLLHILDREQQDVELLNGIMDKEKCSNLLAQWVDAAEIYMAFICGPEVMMLQASEALQDAGVARDRIKFELFASQAGKGRAPRKTNVTTKSQSNCEVDIIVDGRRRTIDMKKGEQTVLDAGTEQGLELPYACKGGVCSTCRALLVEGDVDMDVNFALEDYEVQRGYILTCQSYPVSDKIVVDYDQ